MITSAGYLLVVFLTLLILTIFFLIFNKIKKKKLKKLREGYNKEDDLSVPFTKTIMKGGENGIQEKDKERTLGGERDRRIRELRRELERTQDEINRERGSFERSSSDWDRGRDRSIAESRDISLPSSKDDAGEERDTKRHWPSFE